MLPNMTYPNIRMHSQALLEERNGHHPGNNNEALFIPITQTSTAVQLIHDRLSQPATLLRLHDPRFRRRTNLNEKDGVSTQGP